MAEDYKQTDLRTMKMSTSSGKNVKDTKQLEGEAKDSLSGSNTTQQYVTNQSVGKTEGPMGGGAHY